MNRYCQTDIGHEALELLLCGSTWPRNDRRLNQDLICFMVHAPCIMGAVEFKLGKS